MSAMHQEDGRGKKRKRKRSQMQMAKKFARQRNRGTDVDSDTYQYMVRVLELMRGDFPSFEEKQIFVNNVYEQTVGHELEYARNQVGSRVLDSLLVYANLGTIQRLVDAFTGSLRPLCSDRFGSHVLQKIVLVCADRGNGCNVRKASPACAGELEDAIAEVNESEVRAYNDIVLKLGRYFVNNVEEFVFDTYANHLLRASIECLGGLIDKPEKEDKKKPAVGERRPVIEEYKDLLVESCQRLHKWPQFLEFGRDELTSGLLQSILYSTKDIDSSITEAYVKKITEECFKPGESGKLSSIFETECSVRLLEVCLAVANPERFSEIYEKYFAGHFELLPLSHACNFSVQRLLDHCPAKEYFEKVYDELSSHLPAILKSGYTGVLASLSNACLRLQTRQGACLKDMTSALGCEGTDSPSRIVACIAALKTQEELEGLRGENSRGPYVTLHGSLMVQAILNFNKPIKIVNSLLETSGEDLVRLFDDPRGSRIVDAFMDSKFIGEKSREKLAKKLKGCWSQLATSTHGSRSLEKIWNWARANQRLLIMEELAAAGESLRSTKSGKIISTKLNVPLFARSKKDWTEAQGKEEKTRALFANIIGTTSKQWK